SVSRATTPGAQYYWYIHSRDSYGNWSGTITTGSFSCAIYGVCNNSVINGCSAGTLNDTADDASNYLWL
ncbi:hypothetical protein ACSQ92_23250, partial [Salmonella enterica]|uniref:hypothetical protein n=1 Tax=Salmonella enterica TaxID=28901 RepID=UPI003EDC06D2